jgi:hypothetical protein
MKPHLVINNPQKWDGKICYEPRPIPPLNYRLIARRRRVRFALSVMALLAIICGGLAGLSH